VGANTEQAVELFLDGEQAEAFIAEEEPDTAALLSVVTLEFEQAPGLVA
jgi:hypothetical protein